MNKLFRNSYSVFVTYQYAGTPGCIKGPIYKHLHLELSCLPVPIYHLLYANMLKRNKIWYDLTLRYFAEFLHLFMPNTVGFGYWMTDNRLLFMIKRFNWLSTNTTARSLTLLLAARCIYNTLWGGRSPKLKCIHLSAFFFIGRLYSDLSKTLFMTSLSHCHTLYTCLSHLTVNCGKYMTKGGRGLCSFIVVFSYGTFKNPFKNI